LHIKPSTKRVINLLVPIFSVLASMLVGCVLILINNKNPLVVYLNLLKAAFGFSGFNMHSALLTSLQFSTPLLLSGLSAMVAFRAKFISLGQFGQMMFGAAISAWLGSRLSLPPIIHPIIALAGGAFFGGLWGLVPGFLKTFFNANEVLVTLILNPIAVILVGLIRSSTIAESAQLIPLVQGTRFTTGFIIALAAALFTYFYLWRASRGFEHRMTGEAPDFSNYGGIPAHLPILRGMFISGALAGLAGAVEVLGVHHHFVSSFSAVSEFDGIIVALMGMVNPIGVTLAAIFLGGLRAGALVGLQIESGVPRELGGLLIAMTVLILANERLFKDLVKTIMGWLNHMRHLFSRSSQDTYSVNQKK
jgi:ABC-type uncharacterized transport system permease subunit